MRDPLGQQLVQEKIQYPELFMDLEQLRKLPDDTLGREYARQLDERDIVRGRIAEAWDIPSVHAVRPQMP